jgi:glycerol uptake facilitator-like aquaporin
MTDKHPIVHTFVESMMILFFELLGTTLLTSLFMMNGYNPLGMFVGYFALLVLSARISGSHYNPIVTLAFMLRKDAGQFNKWLGILYMVAQFLGGLCGAFIAFYVFRNIPGADNVLVVNPAKPGGSALIA